MAAYLEVLVHEWLSPLIAATRVDWCPVFPRLQHLKCTCTSGLDPPKEGLRFSTPKEGEKPRRNYPPPGKRASVGCQLPAPTRSPCAGLLGDLGAPTGPGKACLVGPSPCRRRMT